EARTVDSCPSGTRPPGGSADQPRERRPRLPERPLVPHPLEVVRDDLGLVPAAVPPALERAEDRAQGQDALAEERAVHRPERHALHVRDLHRMDAAGSVAPDRREEPPLPARVEEVEHVPPAPARRTCSAPWRIAPPSVPNQPYEPTCATSSADARKSRIARSTPYAPSFVLARLIDRKPSRSRCRTSSSSDHRRSM